MFTACSAHIHRMFTACSFRLVAVTFWIFADQADLTRIEASAGRQSWVTLMLADSRGDLGGQAAGTRSILVAGRRRALQCWKAWREASRRNSTAGKRGDRCGSGGAGAEAGAGSTAGARRCRIISTSCDTRDNWDCSEIYAETHRQHTASTETVLKEYETQ